MNLTSPRYNSWLNPRLHLNYYLHHHVQKRASLVGTFRFDSINSRARNRRGWNVSGCYCSANSRYCDCSRSSNRVRMLINQRQKSAKKVRYRSRKKTGNGVISTTIRIRSGCFCDTSGCRGTTCNRLDGCVCNRRGRCWGNRCAFMSMARSESMREQLRNSIISLPEESSLTELSNKTHPELTSNHVSKGFASNFVSSTSSSSSSSSSVMSNIEGCLCDHNECKGFNCDTMQGCFCTLSGCFGLWCDKFGESEIEERFLMGKIKGLKGLKFMKGLQIGQTWPSIGEEDVGDFMGGEMNPLSGKINSMFDGNKLNNLKQQLTGKFKTVKKGKLKPLNPTQAIDVETVLGKEITKLEGIEALKKLKGEDVMVVKGYPIDSVIGIPLQKLKGIEVNSTPGSVLKAISGNPTSPVSGINIPKLEGFPMKAPASFQSNVQKLQGISIKSSPNQPINTIISRPVSTAQDNPLKFVSQSSIPNLDNQPMELNLDQFSMKTAPTKIRSTNSALRKENPNLIRFADWKKVYS